MKVYKSRQSLCTLMLAENEGLGGEGAVNGEDEALKRSKSGADGICAEQRRRYLHERNVVLRLESLKRHTKWESQGQGTWG